MLKMTKCRIELISDSSLYLFFESFLKGKKEISIKVETVVDCYHHFFLIDSCNWCIFFFFPTGGLSVISDTRAASLNHPAFPNYDPTKPITYLYYTDCNNL